MPSTTGSVLLNLEFPDRGAYSGFTYDEQIELDRIDKDTRTRIDNWAQDVTASLNSLTASIGTLTASINAISSGIVGVEWQETGSIEAVSATASFTGSGGIVVSVNDTAGVTTIDISGSVATGGGIVGVEWQETGSLEATSATASFTGSGGIVVSVNDTAGVTTIDFSGSVDVRATRGPAGQTVWVAAANVSGSEYANGLAYVPLLSASAEQIEFQFVAVDTGDIEVNVMYAMSSADTGTVECQLDYVAISTGSAPTTSLTAQDPVVITPGNNTNLQAVNASTTSSMTFSATDGDIVLCTFQRLASANDTHPGNMNIVEVRVK